MTVKFKTKSGKMKTVDYRLNNVIIAFILKNKLWLSN